MLNYLFVDDDMGDFLVQESNYTSALCKARAVADNPEYFGVTFTDWEAECSGLDTY